MKKFLLYIAISALFLFATGCNNDSKNGDSVSIEDMYIAPSNQSVTLVCGAETDSGDAVYQWYESQDASTSSGIAIEGATNQTFDTPVFTENGIHYYYCTATALSDGKEVVSVSKIASVARTGLPTIYIDTPDGTEITSKEDWLKNAEISIVGAKNEKWNFEKTVTSIRGRGNSTWDKPKKPYAVKLKKARKIMGMPAHKRWVLIANYFDTSFMRNEIAFYLSRTFEMDWTVSGEFADLVLNGRYQGLYWFGEAIKVDKNRINIDDGNENMADNDDKDYLIEMDSYFDETLKFRSDIRDLPYMIKNDDYMLDDNGEISNGGEARLYRLQAKINHLETLLYPDFAEKNTNQCSAPDESYAKIIDIDSWVKFWLVNEIMDNKELGKPRSAFFTFDSVNNILKAGPVWDFDWTFRYWFQCQLQETIYYNALFKSHAFIARTKEIWEKYRDSIDIADTVESIRSKISVAAEYDTIRWGVHKDNEISSHGNFDTDVSILMDELIKKISVVDSSVNSL